MAKIKIDPEALNRGADLLQEQIVALQELNTRLVTLTSRIQGSWEGQASERYIAEMQACIERVQRMVTVLTAFKQYIENANEKFSMLDMNAASHIGGLL